MTEMARTRSGAEDLTTAAAAPVLTTLLQTTDPDAHTGALAALAALAASSSRALGAIAACSELAPAIAALLWSAPPPLVAAISDCLCALCATRGGGDDGRALSFAQQIVSDGALRQLLKLMTGASSSEVGASCALAVNALAHDAPVVEALVAQPDALLRLHAVLKDDLGTFSFSFEFCFVLIEMSTVPALVPHAERIAAQKSSSPMTAKPSPDRPTSRDVSVAVAVTPFPAGGKTTTVAISPRQRSQPTSPVPHLLSVRTSAHHRMQIVV